MCHNVARGVESAQPRPNFAEYRCWQVSTFIYLFSSSISQAPTVKVLTIRSFSFSSSDASQLPRHEFALDGDGKRVLLTSNLSHALIYSVSEKLDLQCWHVSTWSISLLERFTELESDTRFFGLLQLGGLAKTEKTAEQAGAITSVDWHPSQPVCATGSADHSVQVTMIR